MSSRLKPTINFERIELHKYIPLRTPLVIYIEPSGYCNLKCKFCPHGIGNEGTFKKDLMRTDLFGKLIDDLFIFSDKIKLLRICGNGEPLMNGHILEMLEYPKIKKVSERIELVTNGLFLNSILIQELPLLVDRIIISIEGLSGEDYHKFSGVKIDFRALIKNIAVLYHHRRDCRIHIKAHNIAVSSSERRKKFFDIFRDISDEIYIENLVPMWPQFKIPYFSNKFRWGGRVVKKNVCPQIFKSLQIQADGEVVPCCVDWNRVNLLGNVNKNSLFEIWNGYKLRKLQIRHLSGEKNKIEPCKNCTMNDYCEVDNIDSYASEILKRLKK